MRKERRIIHVNPDSDLALLIKDAAASRQPVLVDTGEAVSAVEIDRTTSTASATSHVPSADEVTASQEGIRKAAGSWKDVDVAAFKAYIAERRRSSSRPPVQL